MKALALVMSSIAMVGIVGCGGGGGGGYYSYYIPTNSELTTMITNAVDNKVAHPYGYDASGWKQKDPTAKAGWFVMGMTMSGTTYNGSYFPGSSSNYSYIAINTDEWTNAARARGMSVSDFTDRYFSGNFNLSPDEQYRMFRGVSYYGSGYYIDSYGNMYDSAGTTQKDLETLEAIDTEAAVKETGRKLAAEFSLSEEQGFRVARVASEWQTISKSRQMTSKDVEAFTKDVIGVDMSNIRNAAKRASEGDVTSINKLINDAADKLDTTPENVKALMASFVTK